MILNPQHLSLIQAYQSRTLPSDDILKAAVSVILRDSDLGTECLMMQRAYHEKDPWSGQMGFPGGKIDPEDSSAWHAALRETKEEVSLDLSASDYIGRLDDVYGIKVNNQFSVHISSFVFKPKTIATPIGNHEVADLVWLPLSYLTESEYAVEHYHPFDTSLHMPAIGINKLKGQVLWGLSLRILASLFHVLSTPVGALGEYDRQQLMMDSLYKSNK